jgi:hypothetical protein
LFDDFILDVNEAAGVKRGYECIVTNVLGHSVRMLCHQNRISLPCDAMKQVVFYVLLGLDYLHSLKDIFHGGEARFVNSHSTSFSLFLIYIVVR